MNERGGMANKEEINIHLIVVVVVVTCYQPINPANT